MLDAALPERFGFREFWIDGRDFYLNGTRIYLAAIPIDNAQGCATLASYEARTRSLSIRTDKGPVEFTLGDKATVRVGSHVLSEGEIAAQTGRRVKVRYTQASGKRVVQTMMISRPPLDERLFLSPHP